MKNSIFYFFLMVTLLTGCTIPSPLRIEWQHIGNDVEPGIMECQFSLTNTTDEVLKGGEVNEQGVFEPYWQILFNHMWGFAIPTTNTPLRDTLVENYTYHTLIPTATFPDLAPGASMIVRLRYKGSILRLSHGPESFHIVYREHAPRGIKAGKATPVTYVPAPVTSFEPYMRKGQVKDTMPVAGGEYVYKQNLRYSPVETEGPNLLPMVKHVRPIQPVNTDTLPEEGYIIQFEKGLPPYILSRTEAGTFYAKQTLEYLYDIEALAGKQIYDYPDYGYRGLMLDIARNYPGKEEILRIVNAMSRLKLNHLQLHLCDNEAWRLEIPELPALTDISSRRGYEGTANNPLLRQQMLYPQFGGGTGKEDNNMGNGYLTERDFIELLQYAAARQITIIPEVDMPAHSRAACRALYPALSNPLLEERPMPRPEFREDVIAVMNPEALVFAETVIVSIQRMYQKAGCPLLYFNIGGDEVPEGILTDDERKTFMDSLLVILKRHHLRPAGWEEIIQFCSSDEQPLCLNWHNGPEYLQALVDSGYPIILARPDRLYFDFCYCNHPQEPGGMWGGYTPEEAVFDWQPPTGGTIIGIQGQMWGEFLRSNEQLESYLYPKMFALAERAWNSASPLSLNRFNDLVYTYMTPHWEQMGNTVHLPLPGIHIEQGLVYMNSRVEKGQIRYTLDGTEPNEDSEIYYEPFTITTDPSLLRARVFYMRFRSYTTRL